MSHVGGEPRLVVPEGFVIDEGVRERLERRLARVPAAVAGIAAGTGELPPGASYRVHAEWRSLDADAPDPNGSDDAAAGGRERVSAVTGAALLRPGVAYEVRGDVVDVGTASLLVDPTAHVHDPHRAIGALQDASELGRPPFPRRPVVLFLACERTGLADWARALVNRLVRRDVEGRIAVPDVAEGLHLTRPCKPGAGAVHALAPDVVVTLDAAAAARVDAWCAGNRSTIVVGFDPDGPPEALVSWQIGRAAGRLRARIGPDVDATSFASLVNRLCAGPHPIPPSDPSTPASAAAVRERWTTAGTRPACSVLTGAATGRAALRIDGLVDNLSAADVPVTRYALARGVPVEARSAALVLIAGDVRAPAVDELVAERRRAGQPTVVDLGADALAVTDTGGRDAPRLTEAAAALASACGLVVSPIGAVRAAAEAMGLRALLLPTLMTRTRANTLRAARLSTDPARPVVIGWEIGAEGEPVADYVAVVAEIVTKTIGERSGARLEIVGDASRGPVAKRSGARVDVVSAADLDADKVARWTVHVWTPPVIGGEIAGDPIGFEEATYAGVPGVLPALARRVVDGFVAPDVLAQQLDAPDAWAWVVRHVVGSAERRAHRAREAQRRADALDGLAASRATVNRFVGWARFAASERREEAGR